MHGKLLWYVNVLLSPANIDTGGIRATCTQHSFQVIVGNVSHSPPVAMTIWEEPDALTSFKQAPNYFNMISIWSHCQRCWSTRTYGIYVGPLGNQYLRGPGHSWVIHWCQFITLMIRTHPLSKIASCREHFTFIRSACPSQQAHCRAVDWSEPVASISAPFSVSSWTRE